MAYIRARTYELRIRSVCDNRAHYGTAEVLAMKYEELARAETDPVRREVYMNYRENYVRGNK